MAKNILFLSFIGFLSYFFLLPDIENLALDRIESFIFLSIFSLLYFSLVFIFNIKDFRFLILEIKKLIYERKNT